MNLHLIIEKQWTISHFGKLIIPNPHTLQSITLFCEVVSLIFAHSNPLYQSAKTVGFHLSSQGRERGLATRFTVYNQPHTAENNNYVAWLSSNVSMKISVTT